METNKVKSILLVGVGGQGTLLASKVLTTGLMTAGFDVKMNEIHGMSQRGGAVSSHVRYGDKVFSPIIDLGTADVLVSFEEMEALRWLEYLKPEGKVVVNRYRKEPVPVLTGERDYPGNLPEIISGKADTSIIDAEYAAVSLGNIRVMNMVLIGALIKILEMDFHDWENVITNLVKPDFIKININAFKAGQELIQS